MKHKEIRGREKIKSQ